MKATKTHHYRGEVIRPCVWATGEHTGQWLIQLYHEQTGLPWADEECPHYATLAEAREAIKQRRVEGAYHLFHSERTRLMPYEIVHRQSHDDAWSHETIGDNNEFASLEEAQDAIDALIALGNEWAEGHYGVRDADEQIVIRDSIRILTGG